MSVSSKISTVIPPIWEPSAQHRTSEGLVTQSRQGFLFSVRNLLYRHKESSWPVEPLPSGSSAGPRALPVLGEGLGPERVNRKDDGAHAPVGGGWAGRQTALLTLFLPLALLILAGVALQLGLLQGPVELLRPLLFLEANLLLPSLPLLFLFPLRYHGDRTTSGHKREVPPWPWGRAVLSRGAVGQCWLRCGL